MFLKGVQNWLIYSNPLIVTGVHKGGDYFRLYFGGVELRMFISPEDHLTYVKRFPLSFGVLPRNDIELARRILDSKPEGSYLSSTEEGNAKFYLKFHQHVIQSGNLLPPLIDDQSIEDWLKSQVYCIEEDFEIRRCNSIVDFSPLFYLTPRCRKRVLESFNIETLRHFEDVIIDLFSEEDAFTFYLEIVYFFSQFNNPELKIHYNGTVNHLNHPIPEGDDWAMDRYFEVALTCQDEKNEELPLQLIEEAPSDEPDLKVLLESGEFIPAHRAQLACYSELFKTAFSGQFKESQSETFSFVGYSDVAVAQFLEVANGKEPDFIDCDPSELVRLADQYRSPVFMTQVCSSLRFDEEGLMELVMSKLWSKLPQKKTFFFSLADKWRSIIDSLLPEEASLFRQTFLDEWKVYHGIGTLKIEDLKV